jgi:hypothetical protein
MRLLRGPRQEDPQKCSARRDLSGLLDGGAVEGRNVE